MKPQRIWSPYEKTQLALHAVDSLTADASGDMPVEYITGYVPFRGHQFVVSPEVLIPRVETEELVALILTKLQPSIAMGHKLTIADIGTGSGVIGISLAQQLLARKGLDTLTLSDISPQALEVASQNVNRLLPTGKVYLRKSHLFQSYPQTEKFDLVVANLPYIPSGQLKTLDPSVRKYEPTIALDGGKDGFELIRSLITQLPNRLTATGSAWLEIDVTHTAKLFQDYPQFNIELLNDSYGNNRFAHLQWA